MITLLSLTLHPTLTFPTQRAAVYARTSLHRLSHMAPANKQHKTRKTERRLLQTGSHTKTSHHMIRENGLFHVFVPGNTQQSIAGFSQKNTGCHTKHSQRPTHHLGAHHRNRQIDVLILKAWSLTPHHLLRARRMSTPNRPALRPSYRERPGNVW